MGYTTVSHFNVVHTECHMQAVKVCRARDEWESAALHNANTLANGLLPLWGPQIPESVFANCLARHNTYLQECTQHRDLNYTYTLHDLKLLLLKFAHERSFSDESGGGGPQSNMNLLPHIFHLALYCMNTTRGVSREERRIETFMEETTSFSCERWVDSSYEVEGPHFTAVVAMAVCSVSRWNSVLRVPFLKRLLVTAHVRNSSPTPPHGGKISSKTPGDWSVYKSAAIFWVLIDRIYNIMFKAVRDSPGEWHSNLPDYIRFNDVSLLESSTKVLGEYQSELLPCTSFAEFCDVASLHDVTDGNADTWLQSLLDKLP